MTRRTHSPQIQLAIAGLAPALRHQVRQASQGGIVDMDECVSHGVDSFSFANF